MEKLRKSRNRWDANKKIGLEDVECDAEENLEVLWLFNDRINDCHLQNKCSVHVVSCETNRFSSSAF